MSLLKIIIFKLFILLSIINLSAQCDESLKEKAITESGDSALFLKSFKAKLKKGKLNRPERVAKYLVNLKNNITYRFNVLNDSKSEGKVILQLFKKDEFQNSTYNFENNTDDKLFDFYCTESGTYEILMSFSDGKAGCAVGIMSMILNDSTEIDEEYISELLYLGVKNPLYISYDEKPGHKFHVNSSQGTVKGYDGNFSIELEETGYVIINAQVTDSLGNITEKISQAFKVINIPIPQVGINGKSGGIINKNELLYSKGPELNISTISSYKYEIISFCVAKGLSDIIEINSTNNEFSLKQKNFFNNLKSGSEFYLTNIKVKFPDGKIIKINPQKFIIQKDDF